MNADNAREIEELWSLDPDTSKSRKFPSEPGLSLAAMLDAIESGDIKALWVIGSNPVLGSDNPDPERYSKRCRSSNSWLCRISS